MGWVWRNKPGDDDDSECRRNGEFRELGNPNTRSDGYRCSTRKVVKSQCKTEEVEPGRFIRKCERTEEILRDCVGRPVEVVQSNKEYTEDDVTDQVLKGSFPAGSSERGPLDFPGLHSDINSIERSFNFPGLRGDIDAIERSFNFPGLHGDIDAIERSFFGGVSRFFEAAEEMKNDFFKGLGEPRIFDGDSSSSSSSSSRSRGVPIESDPQQEAYRKRNKPDSKFDSGLVDLSGLARDV